MPLVIRKEQFAALQLRSDVRWYEGQLAELYPPFAAAPHAQRLEWINGGLQRASAAGLGRPDFFQFLCFEQTFSPGCIEESPFEWARSILTEPGKSSADRIKRLRQETIRHLLEIEAREEQHDADAAKEEVVIELDERPSVDVVR
jgi:hypothetical protein